MKIPKYIKILFWDTDRINPELHFAYIINRVLDYGNPTSVKWLLKHFTSKQIRYVIKHRRGLSRKTAYFWAYYYKIPIRNIECLKKYYPRNLRPF